MSGRLAIAEVCVVGMIACIALAVLSDVLGG